MAAESKTRFDKQSTLSFTLPISCQICLGKVKQPVLCPNNHVFCGSCMEVWLNRNQQCPSCRVDINPGNPIQQIRGGLNHFDEESERLNTNPQMRKARFELLYKEYEDEFERLQAEIHILKSENEVLRSQVKKENGEDKCKEFTHPSSVDGGQVLALTRKLQDSQKQYDRLKQEANRNKQENNELKDENVNLNRENERLRLEIVSRSPHRYGRYTVATLESKVEGYEKEIKQLNKALERSDKYIEDLQKQLELYGHKQSTEKPKLSKDYSDFNGSILDTKSEVDASKRRLFSDEGHFSQKSAYDKTDPVQFALDLYRNSTKSINSENDVATASQIKDKAYPNLESPGQKKWKSSLSGNSPQKDRTPKKVQFDLKKDNDSASFNLDRPSPLTPSTYLGKLSLSDTKSPSSAKKYLNFGEVERPGSSKSTRNLEFGSQESLDDTGQIKSELDELNISMTPELSDCMKLMNRAEKNVHVSKSQEEAGNSKGIAHFVAPVGSLVPGMTFNTIMNEYPLSVYHLSCNKDASLSENKAPELRHSVPFSSSNTNYSSSTAQSYSNSQTSNLRSQAPTLRHLQVNGGDSEIGQVYLSASSSTSSFPFNPFTGSRSQSTTTHLTSQQSSYHILPSSTRHAYTTNPSIVSQSSILPLSNNQTDINQNFSTLGLSDMVRRGQDILKTMDLKQSDLRSLTPVVSAPSHSSYTTSVSQFQPILSTKAETKSSFYDALMSKNRVTNGIEAPPNFPKGNNFANLPKFDIPQSLIIPSPNLSAEFASDKQSNGSHLVNAAHTNSQNGALYYQSKPSVDCQSKNVPPTSLTSYQSSNQNSAFHNSFSKSLPLSAALPSALIPSTTISSHFFSSTGFSSSASLPSVNPESHASSSQHQPQKPTELIQNGSQMNGNRQQTSNTAKGDNSMNSLDFSGTGNSDSFRLDAPTGNYSYVSNDLSSRGSDSFLPEPKKRLFQSDDSLDISMSPIKTSRHY